MQLFIFWIGTIVTKYILDEIFVIELMKELAKEGYYLSEPKVDKLSNNIKKTSNDEEKVIDKLIPFIPIINIIDSMQFVFLKNEILSQLDTMNLVSKMTEEERKIYEKKPTLLTILKITMGMKKKKDFTSFNSEKLLNENESKCLETKDNYKKEKKADEIDKLHEIMHKFLNGEINIEDLNNLSYAEKVYILEEAKKEVEEEKKRRKIKIKK